MAHTGLAVAAGDEDSYQRNVANEKGGTAYDAFVQVQLGEAQPWLTGVRV